MTQEIIEALEESIERFPRLSGLMLGIILHPFFSALVYR